MNIKKIVFSVLILFSGDNSKANWEELWNDELPSSQLLARMYSEDAFRIEITPQGDDISISTYAITDGRATPVDTENLSIDQSVEYDTDAFKCDICAPYQRTIRFDEGYFGTSLDLISPNIPVEFHEFSAKTLRANLRKATFVRPAIDIDGDVDLITRGDVLIHHYPGGNDQSSFEIGGKFNLKTNGYDFSVYGCDVRIGGKAEISARDAIFDVVQTSSNLFKTSVKIFGDLKMDLTHDYKVRLSKIICEENSTVNCRDAILKGAHIESRLHNKINASRGFFSHEEKSRETLMGNFPIGQWQTPTFEG